MRPEMIETVRDNNLDSFDLFDSIEKRAEALSSVGNEEEVMSVFQAFQYQYSIMAAKASGGAAANGG